MSSDKAVLDVIAWVLKDDCAESELVEKLNAHLEAKHPELNAAPTTSERFRGRTPLSLAIRKHKPEVVRCLLRHGADPNFREPHTGNYPLIIAIMDTTCDMSILIRRLLAAGALVDFLCARFHKCDDSDTDWRQAVETFGKQWKAAQQESESRGQTLQRLLESGAGSVPVTESVWYWLTYVQCRPVLTSDVLKRTPPPLIELEILGTVGQRLAKRQFSDAVSTWWHFKELRDKPTVMAFCGPSGHGKTQMALEFVRAMRLAPEQTCVIDCNVEADSVNAILGSGAGYVNSERSSRLNEFMKRNHDRPAVLVLDEFEKAGGRSVYEAFMSIFDKGVYRDRQDDNKEYRMHHMLVIVTTNAADPVIYNYLKQHGQLVANEATWNVDHEFWQRHAASLSHAIMPALVRTFTAAVAGRFTSIVPFVTFTPIEAAVVADQIFRVPWLVRKPPHDDRAVGNVEMRCVGRVNQYFADEYFRHGQDTGARAIDQFIRREVTARLAPLWQTGTLVNGTATEKTDLFVWVGQSAHHGSCLNVTLERPMGNAARAWPGTSQDATREFVNSRAAELNPEPDAANDDLPTLEDSAAEFLDNDDF